MPDIIPRLIKNVKDEYIRVGDDIFDMVGPAAIGFSILIGSAIGAYIFWRLFSIFVTFLCERIIYRNYYNGYKKYDLPKYKQDDIDFVNRVIIPRHSLKNALDLIGLLISTLIFIAGLFFAMHVIHTPFSVLASVGLIGLLITISAGPFLQNYFGLISIYGTHLIGVGDYIIIGSNHGFVVNMGIFHTQINLPSDGKANEVQTYIPNNVISNGVCKIVPKNEFRRLNDMAKDAKVKKLFDEYKNNHSNFYPLINTSRNSNKYLPLNVLSNV